MSEQQTKDDQSAMRPRIPQIGRLPSAELLRAWAASADNQMCWGLDAVADELVDLRASLVREENARKVLAAENDRLRKDYRRYGFLRSARPSDKITVETFGHPDGVCHLGGDDLDAAIDEAMGKQS
jgi:hypothetical protein